MGDTADGFEIPSLLAKASQITQRTVLHLAGKGPGYQLFTCFGSGKALAGLSDWFDQGKLKINIDKVSSRVQFG